MMNCDPYDTGTPKYQTAQSIYDALCDLVQTEEMNILSEMGADVSYDNQSYYYTDKGYELKEKFEKLTDYGDKMWLMDLAAFQIDESEIHDIIFTALHNDDMAKRLGFKKLFVEIMLKGDKWYYDEIAEAFKEEISELDRFDNWGMIKAFNKIMRERNIELIVSPYPNFAHALVEKAKGLRISEQTQLVAECRAHLSSYDDFIYGLRVNQALHEALERSYNAKAMSLDASYGKRLQLTRSFVVYAKKRY